MSATSPEAEPRVPLTLAMRSIKITDRIKIGAASLLLVCIVLPFSSCSRELDEDGKSSYISEKPTVEVVSDYTYVWEDFDPKEKTDWLLLLLFVWPIPILVHRYRSKRERIKQILWILEPLLLGGSSYYLWFASNFFADPAIGAYLAQIANATYGGAWVSEIIMRVRNK